MTGLGTCRFESVMLPERTGGARSDRFRGLLPAALRLLSAVGIGAVDYKLGLCFRRSRPWLRRGCAGRLNFKGGNLFEARPRRGSGGGFGFSKLGSGDLSRSGGGLQRY